MSKPGKSAATAKANVEELPFEEALRRLEAVVEAMEAEELPLETLLQRYEEGVRLQAVCQAKLAEAELKIQQLEKHAAGGPVLKPPAFDESNAQTI